QSITSEIAVVSGLTTSNDTDIATLTTNLVTTGQTLQTQITSNDGDITTLTSNLVTTGQTLTTNINTVSTNLVSTGKVIDDVSGNLITTGQTLQTQITNNDSDISTLTSNLVTTGQTLTSEISTLSGLAALDSETGSLIDTSMTGDFADTTILESFAQGLNVGTSSDLASRKLHVVGDIEVSGTIYQSGSVFEGGGGGGGSSTFTGLSDTPGSFTANKYLSVNSAGNAIEMVDTIQSGYQSVDQGYFTGLTLGGTGTGILQNASGTISNLDLADNKFDVSVIEERDANVGDTNFDDVSLLLPFDGSDTATSTSDESDNSHTITFAGTAQLDTAQKKFGSASLLLDGNSDYIQVADHDSFDFDAGNFTVECWIRFAALGNNTIFSHFANGTASSMSYYLTYFNSTTTLRLGHYLGTNADTSYSWSPSTGTWYHIALVRNGTTLKVYIDGTSVISVSASTTALGASEDPFRVGVFNDASTGSPTLDWYFNGHIDDLRITKGLARYTSNFTAPSAAHRTSANIVENKYIGQIGGIDDSDVDYGIEKLSNSQLMIKKLSDNTFTPDRLYVNVNKLGALGKGIAFNKLYTGDGTTTNFAIPTAVDNVKDVLVSVQGLTQVPTTDYTLAG
ncbi:MAG: LamG domain-containing protein, partial [Anaerolineales bacterium]|nr:LamG domain-containing protein [Anaerolineales bacterium]